MSCSTIIIITVCRMLLTRDRHLVPLANKSQTDGDTGPSVTIQAAGGIQDSVTAEARTGANNDPTTLKFYDAVWKAVLNCTKSLSHFDAVIDDAFPEWHVYISKRAIEFISQAIAEFEEDNVQPDKSFLKKHQHYMGELLFDDLSTFRSNFKKIARQATTKHWDWEPSDFDNPQQLTDHALELYNDLTMDTQYIHGNCDEEGKFDNFLSTALRDLCVTAYYIGKSSLAASFLDTFSKHLPAAALAFTVMELTATVDEYSTGALIAVKFRHEDYSKVYKQFLEIIGNIDTVPHCL